MSEHNRYSPLLPPLPDPVAGEHHWGRLYGSSKALTVSQAASRTGRPVLILTRDSLSASRLLEELHFFRDPDIGLELLPFPDWETLPYDPFSPYHDIVSERLNTLSRLPNARHVVLVASITTLMHRLMPRDYLLSHSLVLEQGQKIDLDDFRKQLTEAGYVFTAQVMQHGEAATRGSLLDIFPMGASRPFRIDLFDDEIDSIREFDPESQRSMDTMSSVHVLPAREVALIDEGIARFRQGWRARFEGNPNQCPVYRDVSQGLAPAGIEYYLPLFYPETNSLFDYLSDDTLLFLDENVGDAADTFWKDIGDRYEQMHHDRERPLLPPEEMFFSPEQVSERIKPMTRIAITSMMQEDLPGAVNFATTLPAPLPIDARSGNPLAIVKKFLNEFEGRVLFVAESAGRRETLLELFSENGIKPTVVSDWHDFLSRRIQLGLTVSILEHGAQIDDPPFAVISESQLFGERVMQRRLRKRRQQDTEAIIKNLTELTPGAPVVHVDHGIGRYRDLVTLEMGDVPAEFICIEYAQGDKLYVPVGSLNLINRYTGVDPEHAPLHRLGSGQWEKTRKRAAKRVNDIAAELLEINARRAARPGQSFRINPEEYRAFIQSFPFEETPGQADAINAVLEDLRESKPMDRLVCGDSGFGKTEVAMRAAFVAVENGKQVALLVPTTLLAQQHYQNFKDRFADWPVRVEMLSRFRAGREQERVLAGLRHGTVDIVIGTHKLIQDTVRFKRLGLMIIDEEHRFGVRQKEKFKAMRAEIDILTLTATPIPRTLNMSLSSLRELSIIATPPSQRLAVKTFVREWSDALIREAILREIKRGGQVYFLHNQVRSIEKTARQVRELMPEAEVRVAHGQMPEKQLEQVMLDFYHRRFNILVCTTIIETGIDVPSANTIIINRADKFGLAQLYQLRGRVGRSHHRAFAYMIIPEKNALTADAVKRLEAIESLDELGIGFTLATYDLEIRGAGELLGEEQSGQIQEVGFGMYMEMLERAIEALKSGKQPEMDRPLEHGAEINLHVAALIPEDYLPDVHTRLIMYKRIASAKNKGALQDLQEEMIDRFGMLPDPVKNLFRITALKLRANPLGIRKIDLGEQGGRLHFSDDTNVDPGKIINLIQSEPNVYRLDGQDKLRVSRSLPDKEDRFDFLSHLLNTIQTREAA